MSPLDYATANAVPHEAFLSRPMVWSSIPKQDTHRPTLHTGTVDGWQAWVLKEGRVAADKARRSAHFNNDFLPFDLSKGTKTNCNGAHIGAIHAIGLDIDNYARNADGTDAVDADGKKYRAPKPVTKEHLLTVFGPYVGVIYESASSTPEWPRYRVELVIEPFEIMGVAARLALFKSAMELVHEHYRPFGPDRACSGAFRMWFELQRVGKDSPIPWGHVLSGERLFEFKSYVDRVPPPREKKPRAAMGGAPNRVHFDFVYDAINAHLNAANLMENHAEWRPASNKSVGFCLFPENHQSSTHDQEAFAVDAYEAQHEVATVKCSHNGCQHKRAADFVFKVLEINGLGLEVLRDYVNDATDLFDESMKSLPPTAEEMRESLAFLAALGEAPSAEAQQRIIDAIAAIPQETQRDRHIDALAVKCGARVGALRKDVKEKVRCFERVKKHRTGPRIRTYDKPVITPCNDFEVSKRESVRLIAKANEAEPFVFKGRVAKYPVLMEPALEAPLELSTTEIRSSVLQRVAVYVQANGVSKSPAADVCAAVFADPTKDWPELKGVSKIPLVLEDGSLKVEGYDAETGLYVRPWGSVAEVEDPLSVLSEVFEGIWFSDSYGEGESLPRRDGVDADGFPAPNYNRGKSSRANAIGLLITIVARHMIKGAVPLALINKHVPGSGAGNVLSITRIVTDGSPEVEANTLNDDETEIAKELTASLRGGATTLLFDNVVKVHSKRLASGVTGGTYVARVLGTSDNVRIDLSGVVLGLAGNGVILSFELRDRVFLIHLDPAVEHPSDDIPASDYKAKGFYGQTFKEYLIERRERILGAVLAMVQEWVRAGCPAPAKVAHGRFPEWSNVVGGVMEYWGIDGLCDNRATYMAASQDQDAAGDEWTEALTALWVAHGDKAMTMAMVHEAWKRASDEAPVSIGALQDELKVDPLALRFDVLPAKTKLRDVDELYKALRDLFKGHTGKTFTLTDGKVVVVGYKRTKAGRTANLTLRK